MSGHTVIRDIGLMTGKSAVMGIGTREQALATAAEMASSCDSVFHVINPCGKAIATFTGDDGAVFG